ncbi:MAG: HemK/PrmC family methyltransferase [Bdellovibrionia bacterium]
MNFRDALSATKKILEQSPRLKAEGLVDTEAEQLLVAVVRLTTGISLSRLELFSKMGFQPESSGLFPKHASDKLFELAHRRVEGVPLQHLTGVQWFRDHEFEVSPAVLVPRPETEILLDTVLKELLTARITPELGLEIGLGSGVLSIELLSHFPKLRMVASELTEGACIVAKRNVVKILGLEAETGERLRLIRPSNAGEVLEVFTRQDPQGFAGAADFILSNPPYLAEESEVETGVLMYEPHEALFAPQGEPLYFYKNIIDKGRTFLKPSGFVFVELPHERAQLILELFIEKGWFAKTVPDLTGRDRVLVARLIPLEDI